MKSLSIITCDQQNVIKFTHLISKDGENNKGFVKYVFWKVFKKFVKPLMSPFLIMLQTFFYLKRTQMKIEHSNGTLSLLKGHSKGNRRALGHLGIQGTWELGHPSTWGTRSLGGHLDTQGTWALEHSGTLALGHSMLSGHFI